MPITERSVEEELMKEVAADLGIPYKQVRDVVINGQSGFTKHVMENGSYNGVRWPYLGAFKVKANHVRVKKYMKGLLPMYRDILRIRIREGHVFPDKFKRNQNEIIPPK